MRYMGLLWVVLWVFSPLYALDYFQGLDQVRRWSDDFVRQQGYIPKGGYANVHAKTIGNSFSIKGKDYMLLYVINTDKNNTRPPIVCTGIFFKDKVYKGFCLTGYDQLHMKYSSNSFLVKLIKTSKTPTSNTSMQTLLEFTNTGGTFYLKRYATQALDSSLSPKKAPTTYYENGNDTYAMGDVSAALLQRLQTEARSAKISSPCALSTPCGGRTMATAVRTQELLSFNVNEDRYSFSKKATYTDSLYTADRVCIAIKRNQRSITSLCSDGDPDVNVVYKFPYLTIETGDYQDDSRYYKDYITLKVVDRNIYLHQFSRQSFEEKGSKWPVCTWIYYRQSRDDPYKQHLMNMKYLKTGFDDKLVNQCYQHGYCTDCG